MPTADFKLYSDDGQTYAYEQGKSQITELQWSESTQKLEHSGATAWTASDSSIVKIMGGAR